MTRNGIAELVSEDQTLRREPGQEIINFHCSADYEQDGEPYPVDPYSAICNVHTYIHIYIPGGSSSRPPLYQAQLRLTAGAGPASRRSVR